MSICLREICDNAFQELSDIYFFTAIVISDILIYRTCVNTLNYPKSECELLLASGPKSNETRRIENEVQQYASYVTMVQSVILALFPAFLSFFLGVWSDMYGRKPLIVWPLFGGCVSAFLMVIYSTMNNLGPWWILLTAVPYSLSGGDVALITGVYCYITDISTEADRSLRISLLDTSVFTASVVGTLSSPYVLKLIGKVNLLMVTAAVYVLAYVYANIWIVESITVSVRGTFRTMLDCSLVRSMVETCLKRRPNRTRSIIFLLIICSAISILVINGLSNLEYLYTRQKLQWSLESYSIYGAVNTLVQVVGLLVGVTFMQKVLKISDIHLVLLSYLSIIGEYLIRAFAVKSWHMYLGTSVSLFKGLASPLIRSIISKIIPGDDMAKIFSLLGVMTGFLPVVAPLIFNSLYAVTIDVFPGGIYLFCASINTVALGMLW
ncbi:Solute carrier family 46 member 3 [Eumeta japonica]|uniref:Solute carrier family 46 member 3 n=1 Tax=Eumeta variegata TaxID=151549 RepID=A0A4C1T0E3_EUMVA|nr:Solute carrier family 46 member 3 [Eumeta japonica]